MDTITKVPGLRVGNAEDYEGLTGCTVLLAESSGAPCGVDLRGGAPGTQKTDLLRPEMLVEKVHGILLAGGSAFGLGAASGVRTYLRERGIGFQTGVIPVPIVPTAVLYDLQAGKAVWPDEAMAYGACVKASRASVPQGNVGAGCGATVGKLLGPGGMMKGGLGSFCIDMAGGIMVGALVVVNAFGDVRRPEDGRIVAGLQEKGRFLDTGRQLLYNPVPFRGFTNTTLGVVATNAGLDKTVATKVAQMAHNGLARTLFPAHGMLDGDIIFALSTGTHEVDTTALGTAAAEAVAQAVVQAVLHAKSAAGVIAAGDI